MKKTNTIFTKLHADLLRFISKSLPNKTSRYDAFMYLLENQIELINQYKKRLKCAQTLHDSWSL